MIPPELYFLIKNVGVKKRSFNLEIMFILNGERKVVKKNPQRDEDHNVINLFIVYY